MSHAATAQAARTESRCFLTPQASRGYTIDSMIKAAYTRQEEELGEMHKSRTSLTLVPLSYERQPELYLIPVPEATNSSVTPQGKEKEAGSGGCVGSSAARLGSAALGRKLHQCAQRFRCIGRVLSYLLEYDRLKSITTCREEFLNTYLLDGLLSAAALARQVLYCIPHICRLCSCSFFFPIAPPTWVRGEFQASEGKIVCS